MKFPGYKFLFWATALLASYLYFRPTTPPDLVDQVLLPSASFYDSAEDNSDGYVSASGAWLSSVVVAYPLSTVTIDCWKQFSHCWMADSTFYDSNYLSTGLDLHEIAVWNDEFIQTKPRASLNGCVEETYSINRTTKVVTYLRTTVKTTGICEIYSPDPVVSVLGDGADRLQRYRDSKQ